MDALESSASADDTDDATEPADSTLSLTFMLQALLTRHETYVADSEKERRRMMEKIERLEQDNTELEESNRRTVQENRDLLDKLEALNNAIKESEGKTQSLTDVLHSTEAELKSMNGLAARTALLQSQLSQLEEDLNAANSVVVTTREEQKFAILRWHEAEKTIESLHSQMERIEQEAKDEQDRHADVRPGAAYNTPSITNSDRYLLASREERRSNWSYEKIGLGIRMVKRTEWCPISSQIFCRITQIFNLVSWN
jgi:DNA repair exonuclease SbcCD ATPase subunit